MTQRSRAVYNRDTNSSAIKTVQGRQLSARVRLLIMHHGQYGCHCKLCHSERTKATSIDSSHSRYYDCHYVIDFRVYFDVEL